MKTIKEAAREYALGNCGIETFDYLQNAFIAGVEFAQRWISVEEELPEINRPVLTRNNNYATGGLRICIVRKAYADNGDFSHYEFIYYNTGHLIEDVQFWRYIELE
ncbi:MAG: DUF551 domain-containing protein [Prevotellaceae bacterium]|jgi:hypothetical protein|nr:DUF551 domain-containing protein [Prevotellaceae bacterium]